MAYLHCHNCNWSQDDFWDESYNPITFIEKNYTKELLEEPLDRITKQDAEVHGEDGWHHFIEKLTNRERVARVLENHARTVRRMKYRTMEEFEKMNPEKKCPNCGQQELDID